MISLPFAMALTLGLFPLSAFAVGGGTFPDERTNGEFAEATTPPEALLADTGSEAPAGLVPH